MAAAPLTLDPTLQLLATVALRSADARAWLLAEPWQQHLAQEADAGVIARILAADLRPDEPASLAAFLSTLDVAEEAFVSSLLEEKPPENALTIAHDCWMELEKRQIRRRIDALKARQRAPDLPLEQAAALHKEIVDLQERLSDIARPLSPPL
jgi:hypothetical protein